MRYPESQEKVFQEKGSDQLHQMLLEEFYKFDFTSNIDKSSSIWVVELKFSSLN